MSKYFAIALIAATTLAAAAPHGAWARGAQHHPEAVKPVNGASPWMGEVGQASYYGPAYDGRRAADGSRFNQMAMTAAHPWLPFGTKVRVVLAGTGRSVVVTITDRMYSSRRIVDLSLAAARELGMTHRGVARVSLVPV